MPVKSETRPPVSTARSSFAATTTLAGALSLKVREQATTSCVLGSIPSGQPSSCAEKYVSGNSQPLASGEKRVSNNQQLLASSEKIVSFGGKHVLDKQLCLAFGEKVVSSGEKRVLDSQQPSSLSSETQVLDCQPSLTSDEKRVLDSRDECKTLLFIFSFMFLFV